MTQKHPAQVLFLRPALSRSSGCSWVGFGPPPHGIPLAWLGQGLRCHGRVLLGLRPAARHPPQLPSAASPPRWLASGMCLFWCFARETGCRFWAAFSAAVVRFILAKTLVVLPSASAGHRSFALRVEPPSVSQSPSDANLWPLRSCAAAHCVCLLGGLWQAQTPRRSRVWHPPEEADRPSP